MARTVHGVQASAPPWSLRPGRQAARPRAVTLPGAALFPDLDGRVFAIYGYSSADRWSRHARAVEASLQSFARETDRAVLAVKPARVHLVDLSSTTSLAAFLRQYPSTVPAETIALINHVFDGSPLGPGLAKRVTE